MGRPKKKIDPELVDRLAQIQCTYEEIAAIVGCTTKTLQNRFFQRIAIGREKGKKSLRRRQWRAAMKGSDRMLIWLGTQYLGQSSKQEMSGPGGGPLQLQPVPPPTAKLLENKEVREALLRAEESEYASAVEALPPPTGVDSPP